eukprot:TRINITY_DN5208_c0_g2_i1.p1 TRINITY_DN5208_c0_g2~~TRINITY_DN5208_c0_g2_i1.p1  ORF type:complete len:278 (-),score=78.07 TRINITY_DN5208_c0_g2_i1:212-1045(-)
MGCDGGSIEKRDELVKVKKGPPPKDPKEISRIRWSSCTISKEPLTLPVVACALGNLYNKDAVIAHLLAKSMPAEFSHIRGLKDLIDLKLTPNPDASKDGASLFICPITRFEAGGGYSFIAMRPCGCVIARKALKEIQSDECLACGKPYHKDNILTINPNDEELVEIKKKLAEQPKSEKTKKTKKSKSKGEKHSTTSTTSSSSSSTPTSSESSTSNGKRKAGDEKGKKEKKAKIPSFLKPELVDSKVYSSIFTSSLKQGEGPVSQETFLCRNVIRSTT